MPFLNPSPKISRADVNHSSASVSVGETLELFLQQ